MKAARKVSWFCLRSVSSAELRPQACQTQTTTSYILQPHSYRRVNEFAAIHSKNTADVTNGFVAVLDERNSRRALSRF